MKILHTVQNYAPSKGGMQEVVRQLSERLVQKGHHVTVATSAHAQRTFTRLNGVDIQSFNIQGNSVQGIQGDQEAYVNFVKNGEYDVVANFAAQQWATDILLPHLKEIKARKVFIPTGFSALYDPSYTGYFEQMKQWLRHYDANVFLSNRYRDIDFARECGVEKTIVIPNGAALDEFQPKVNIDIRKRIGAADSSSLVLHVGSFTKVKGHFEAIKIFLQSGISNSTLLLIGDGSQRLKKEVDFHPIIQLQKMYNRWRNNRIVFAEYSREETVAAYQQADVFLFPSNIECSPIVLFECMAAKTPFLTADVGNSEEIIEWSKGGLLLPTTKDIHGYSHVRLKESANMLAQVMNDANLRKKLSDNGHASWQQHFTWEVITDRYEQLYSTQN